MTSMEILPCFGAGGYHYFEAHPNQPSFVTGIGEIDHDVRGARIQKGDWHYAYDEKTQLREVRKGNSLHSEFFYDESNNRLVEIDHINDSIRYSLGNRVEIIDGEIIRHFVVGGLRIATDRIPGYRGACD